MPESQQQQVRATQQAPAQQQQQQAPQQQLTPPSNAEALQSSGLANAQRDPMGADGKLHQAHGDHAKLREEAMAAQKKLAAGIKAISGQLSTDAKLVRPLVKDDQIKGIERSNDKIDFKYGGDASRLTDIARGSIVFKDELEVRESFPKVCAAVEGLGWKVVGNVKDRFMDPQAGYRDMLMNVEIDGHIAELQLHVEKMMEAKKDEAGHANYKVVRDLDMQQSKTGSLGLNDTSKLLTATSAMTQHYEGKWAEHEAEMQQDPERYARLQKLRAEAKGGQE